MKLAALIISTIIIAAILIWQAPRAYPATKATLEERKQRQQHTIRHDHDVLRFFATHRRQARSHAGRRALRFHRAQLGWTLRELGETIAALRAFATPWPAWWYQQALCIHHHEGAWSSIGYVNGRATYGGGMQFLVSTWKRAGGSEGSVYEIARTSPREQLLRAFYIWESALSGKWRGSWHEWGTAGRCGLA